MAMPIHRTRKKVTANEENEMNSCNRETVSANVATFNFPTTFPYFIMIVYFYNYYTTICGNRQHVCYVHFFGGGYDDRVCISSFCYYMPSYLRYIYMYMWKIMHLPICYLLDVWVVTVIAICVQYHFLRIREKFYLSTFLYQWCSSFEPIQTWIITIRRFVHIDSSRYTYQKYIHRYTHTHTSLSI